MDRLDVLGLQAFISVAELGSFRRAAARLNLSDTAISRRIQKLEENVGASLFSRTTRQVVLTPLGAGFLPRAQDMLAVMEDGFEDLRTQCRYGERAISIGCLPTVASFFLPPILAKFAERTPNPVQVHDLTATDILGYVRTGKVHFAISFIGAEYHDLTITPLYTEPLVAVVSPDSPFAGMGALNWADLASERLISIGSLSGTRRLIDASTQAHSITLNWSYEVQHLSTAVAFAKAGLGVAVLPYVVKELNQPSLVAVDLFAPKIERRIGLIRRNDQALPKVAKSLCDIIIADVRKAAHGIAL